MEMSPHEIKFTAMNQKLLVLVIGRHADVLEKVIGLLERHGYQAVGSTTDEGALTAVRSMKMDAVLIGGGVETPSRELFHTLFPEIKPGIIVIDVHPQTVLSELEAAFPDR